MLSSDEIPDRVLNLYATTISQVIASEATPPILPYARSLVASLLTALADDADALPTAALVGLAVRAYGHPSITPLGMPWVSRINDIWAHIDVDFPDLRGLVLDDVRRHGVASRSFTRLWDGPEVHHIFDELLDTTTDFDDLFTLTWTRLTLSQDHDDTELLDLCRVALREHQWRTVFRCLDVIGSLTTVTSNTRSSVRTIVDDLIADGPDSRHDPTGRRAAACLVLAGIVDDRQSVREIVHSGIDITAVTADDDLLVPAPLLGRAAMAAHLAGESDAAVLLAGLHVSEGCIGPGGWSGAGESILAKYVLGLHETDQVRRADHFNEAAETARHGQIVPLFALVHFAAADAALACAPDYTSDHTIEVYIGYGRYLESIHAQSAEGHFWNPHPVAAIARYLPATPLPWSSLAVRFAERRRIEVPAPESVAREFLQRFRVNPRSDEIEFHLTAYGCGFPRQFPTLTAYFDAQADRTLAD